MNGNSASVSVGPGFNGDRKCRGRWQINDSYSWQWHQFDCLQFIHPGRSSIMKIHGVSTQVSLQYQRWLVKFQRFSHAILLRIGEILINEQAGSRLQKWNASFNKQTFCGVSCYTIDNLQNHQHDQWTSRQNMFKEFYPKLFFKLFKNQSISSFIPWNVEKKTFPFLGPVKLQS